MEIPLVLAHGCSLKKFNARFGDRRFRENVWRRHQSQENRAVSGWRSDVDQRRRLVHFLDSYTLLGDKFALNSVYLYEHYRAPRLEIEELADRVSSLLGQCGWRGDRCGDIVCRYAIHTQHPFEVFEYQDHDYQNFDIWFYSKEPSSELLLRPWLILSKGIRTQGQRQSPKYCSVSDILPYLPAQMELGCGPSIEAGIPPLNSMHKVYHLWDGDGFLFDGRKDQLMEGLLHDPTAKYRELSAIHVATVQADPPIFYKNLRWLYDRGIVVGPVFTNNFDGLARDVGVPEYHLRQHDSTGEYPNYSFDDRAKSLLVVGSHADRRGVQRAARQRGLPIIFVDPEGYGESDYLLEEVKEEIIVQLTSSEFSEQLRVLLC